MKLRKISITILIAVFGLFATKTVLAQTEKGADKTLSPYFFVKSDNPETDRMPLKSTSAKVNISGVIADVIITQIYKNEGKTPLEAIYVFPASTRAAVYGMKMSIGERTITAKIRERNTARREYQQAKQAGKSASLLEQQRPNVFQMNVANILPEDVIKVELKYTELLIPDDAIYEFVYPTVVGPRYVDQPSELTGTSEDWTSNPYLHEGESAPYIFDMEMDLAGGLPIQNISCVTHNVDIRYKGSNNASIKLNPSEKSGGDRDFILKYRLSGGKIETGLLLSKGEKENFFLLMLQPPKQIKEDQIPPREYLFIVDVSGSMNGFPLNISKKLLKNLIGNLRPSDRFNVLLFAGGSNVMAEHSLPATRQNITHAINVIERQRGGGGTRLLPALKKALSMQGTKGYSRNLVIVTDGYVSVEKEAFDLIRNNLGHANMFAFGIGSSVNRHLIEGLARVGMGEPFIITRPDEASEKATKFRKLIESPVLTGITVDFDRFNAYDTEPPSIPDVMAQRPVILFGKWRGQPQGNIVVRGIAGGSTYIKKVNVAKIKPLTTNMALRYLWARHRIALLSDYNRLSPDDERVKEVTSLGLTYNLLTQYTSFVAIDTQIRLKDGKSQTVKQPLPLPQGVSDYAVGGKSRVARGISTLRATPPLMVQKSKPMEVKDERFKSKEPASSAEEEMSVKEDHKRLPVKLGKVSVIGGLKREAVITLLEKSILSLNRCDDKRSWWQWNVKGVVTFKLRVDSFGKVIKVSRVSGTKKFKGFEDCIMQKLRNLRFASSKASKTGTITVSFLLK
jgi:Ca-activated chloride channel family protein